MKILAQSLQNIIWFKGKKEFPRRVLGLVKGREIRMIKAPNIAMTPPNLLGIDRRIAYNHKKYHSGWIWRGVTKGLAGIKFSGSPNKLGENNAKADKASSKIIKPTVSLVV